MSGEIVDLGSGCSFSNRLFGTSGTTTIGAAWRMHSAFPSGSVVTTTWSGITTSAGVQAGHTFIQLRDQNLNTLWQEFHNGGSGSGSRAFTLTGPNSFLEWGIGTSLASGDISIAWNGVGMTANPCAPP